MYFNNETSSSFLSKSKNRYACIKFLGYGSKKILKRGGGVVSELDASGYGVSKF
jgi:hypothetical protein